MPKSNCGENCKEEHQNFDKIVFGFNPKSSGLPVPKGYFCFKTLQINREYNPVIYWNQSNGAIDEFKLYHEYYFSLQKN